METPMRSRSVVGFSLIELLVVVAIIAILAGLLLPALKKARDTAKNVLCVGNQKQVMFALVNYANDWNGYLPKYYDSVVAVTWYDRLKNDAYIPNYSIGATTILACPTIYPFGQKLSNSGYTYGLAAFGFFHGLPEFGKQIRMEKIGRSFPIITDTISDPYAVPIKQWYCWQLANSGQMIMHMRHHRKANVAFGDGSFEAIGSEYPAKFTGSFNFEYVIDGVVRSN